MTKQKPGPSPYDEYMLTDETASLCRCSASSIARLVKDPNSDFPRPVQFVRRGTWLFPKAEILRYLETKRLRIPTAASAAVEDVDAAAAADQYLPVEHEHAGDAAGAAPADEGIPPPKAREWPPSGLLRRPTS